MTYEHYIKIIHVINVLSLIGGILITIIGATMLPQSVSNNGDKYIGEASAYNEDLRKAQIGSYGFKIIITGLSIIAGNFIIAIARFYYMHLQENVQQPRIQPAPIQAPEERRVTIRAPIQAPTERRVTISPTVIQIPDNEVNSEARIKNIKKWIGNTVIPNELI